MPDTAAIMKEKQAEFETRLNRLRNSNPLQPHLPKLNQRPSLQLNPQQSQLLSLSVLQ